MLAQTNTAIKLSLSTLCLANEFGLLATQWIISASKAQDPLLRQQFFSPSNLALAYGISEPIYHALFLWFTDRPFNAYVLAVLAGNYPAAAVTSIDLLKGMVLRGRERMDAHEDGYLPPGERVKGSESVARREERLVLSRWKVVVLNLWPMQIAAVVNAAVLICVADLRAETDPPTRGAVGARLLVFLALVLCKLGDWYIVSNSGRAWYIGQRGWAVMHEQVHALALLMLSRMGMRMLFGIKTNAFWN